MPTTSPEETTAQTVPEAQPQEKIKDLVMQLITPHEAATGIFRQLCQLKRAGTEYATRLTRMVL